MGKQVLSIGQCSMDHGALSRFLQRTFAAEVTSADAWTDASKLLDAKTYDLILVNRKLDVDYSDGIAVIQRLKADPKHQTVPMMLVTNYAEHQQLAVAAGATLGFGKLEFDRPETLERLGAILGSAERSGS